MKNLLKKRISSWNLSVVRDALLLTRGNRAFLAWLFGFCAMQLAGIPLYTYGIRIVVDSAAVGDFSSARLGFLLIFACCAVWMIYSPVSELHTGRIVRRAMHAVKTELFAHVVRLPQKTLDARPAGYWLSLFSSDADGLQNLYDRTFFKVMIHITQGIGAL